MTDSSAFPPSLAFRKPDSARNVGSMPHLDILPTGGHRRINAARSPPRLAINCEGCPDRNCLRRLIGTRRTSIANAGVPQPICPTNLQCIEHFRHLTRFVPRRATSNSRLGFTRRVPSKMLWDDISRRHHPWPKHRLAGVWTTTYSTVPRGR